MTKFSKVGGGAQGAAAKNGAAGRNADDMAVKEFYNLEFGRMRTVTDKNGEPLFCGQDVCTGRVEVVMSEYSAFLPLILIVRLPC